MHGGTSAPLFGTKVNDFELKIQIVDLMLMECRTSKVECPITETENARDLRYHAVLVHGDRKNDALVFGYVRQSLELPADVILLIGQWLSRDKVHLFVDGTDAEGHGKAHWSIHVDDILRE